MDGAKMQRPEGTSQRYLGTLRPLKSDLGIAVLRDSLGSGGEWTSTGGALLGSGEEECPREEEEACALNARIGA